MQNLKSILYKKKEIFYVIILFLFSVSINQYYGNLGVCPIDSFWFFNSGYDALNGYYPFKDYWTIAGPFITFSQAILFKIFGVSWFSYVFHASIFNFLISIATFYVLYKFRLNTHYCFLYALLIAGICLYFSWYAVCRSSCFYTFNNFTIMLFILSNKNKF